MKPFDLEAAKRGEPIMNNQKDNLDFVGVKRNGTIVVEYVSGQIGVYEPRHLFMAPKKRTVWVNLYQVFYTEDDADAADTIAKAHRFGGKAYPVEIEE